MKRAFFEHKDRVISADEQYKHVMAVALNPLTNYSDGVVRCITSRVGDIEVKGYIDRSELHYVTKTSSDGYEIGGRLEIAGEIEMLNKLSEGGDCIGLEDPDIWIDEDTGLLHLYFTIPIAPLGGTEKIRIHLGHAVGEDLNSLRLTEPVLGSNDRFSAKEVSIAPINASGLRLNLIESRDRLPDFTYSVVQVAIAREMGAKWEYGDIVFHPKEHNILWIGGHASPGPLFPKSFIDIGEGKVVGVINGREANQRIGDEIKYGMFSVGLFIYDYERGKIDWVSEEPFIRGSETKTITFASQFIETVKGEGILYAHVDDSFVRAYTLYANGIKESLP